MMIVKIKSKERAFTIPVPYTVLHMGSGILTSNLIQRKMRYWLNKYGEPTDVDSNREQTFDSYSNQFGIDLVLAILESPGTKQVLRHLIKELQRYKGTVLVDIHAQDGTEVFIKL